MKAVSRKYPLVSIVIPCFNSIGIVDKCLRTVVKTKYPNYEILVIDDVSTDGTYEFIKKKYAKLPTIKILRNKYNSGPSVTRNQGIKASSGKYIAFLETDMEVEANWLGYLVEEMENDFKLGAVQSRTLDINRRDKIHSMGVKYNPHTFWVLSPQCGYDKNYYPEDNNMGIGSVGSMVRKKVLDKIGYYDEKFVHNIDDIELGWRIWLSGYDIKPVPKSITYHWTAKPKDIRAKVTPSAISEFHFNKGARIILKNYEIKNILKYLPCQTLAYLIRALRHLLTGNTTPALAFIKAILWNIFNLKDTLKERSNIQNWRKRSDNEMFNLLGIKSNIFKFYLFDVPRNIRWVQDIFVNTPYKGVVETKKVNCITCGYVFYLDEKPLIKADDKYNYKTCSVCGSGVLLPKPSKNEIRKYYQSSKYYKDLSRKVKNPFIQWVITRGLYKNSFSWVLKNFKKGRIVDVGCGNGEFLENLQNNSWLVYGSDVSPVVQKNVSKIIGKGRVKLGEFDKQIFNKKYDYVSFWHVLEHLDDPSAYVRQAHNILKNGGKVIGEVPNYDSPYIRIFKSNYSWMMLPVHINYFSLKSIRKLLKDIGFNKINLETPPRALLNFALSSDLLLSKRKNSTFIRKGLLVFSVPLSIIMGIILSRINKGEVIRFSAEK